MTRVQKERFDETEYKHIASNYVLTNETLKQAPAHLKVLHPLPRVDEIALKWIKPPMPITSNRPETGICRQHCWL